jgi:hypothetical protein
MPLQEERRHLDDLRRRQAARLAETERAAVLSLGAPEVVGVAVVVPGPGVQPICIKIITEVTKAWPPGNPRQTGFDSPSCPWRAMM